VKSLDRTMTETDRRERWQFALWSTLLCVLVGVAYWPVRSFDFVNWDDTWYVLKNPYREFVGILKPQGDRHGRH
jgi:hypothetical protein